MYKSGYTLRIYQILENDLFTFFNYIPIEYYLGEKRKEIYSPKLSELLLRIGSAVDNFFRNWDIVQSKNNKIDPNKLTIENFKAIEKPCNLSDKEVIIKATHERIKPFKDWNFWKEGDKNWWNAYNHVKHNGFTNKTEGNLFNVIESLSALFLLNCIHKDVKNKLIEYGYRDISPHEARHLSSNGVWIRPSSPYIISQLFEFDERSLSTKMTPLSNTISL